MERLEDAVLRAAKARDHGKFDEAMMLFDRCLAHAPDNAYLAHDIGTTLSLTGYYGMAIFFLQRASATIDRPAVWHNLGLAYRNMGFVDKAVDCYKRVLTYPLNQAEQIAALGNLSGAYINEGAPDKALEWANQGLALQWTPQLANHKALALLERGDYREGFREYEARFQLPEFTKRDFGTVPRWDGQPTERLAIHGEQGLGDEIMFLTMLKKVLPLATEIYVECAPRLLGLLRHSFKTYPQIRFYTSHAELIGRTKPTAWDAMGSLPMRLWPWEKWPYLNSSRIYRKGNWPRLGISWRGGTLKTHEYHRNAPVDDWRPLINQARLQGVEVISVQYGEADDVAKHLEVPHDAASIADLDTLTAMIQSCDLVISVCNTTVHQAGATNTPCIQLVPAKPDWRCGLKGDWYFWYDSVEFIRQAKEESWSSVLLRATERVNQWAQTLPPRLIE